MNSILVIFTVGLLVGPQGETIDAHYTRKIVGTETACMAAEGYHEQNRDDGTTAIIITNCLKLERQ